MMNCFLVFCLFVLENIVWIMINGGFGGQNCVNVGKHWLTTQ